MRKTYHFNFCSPEFNVFFPWMLINDSLHLYFFFYFINLTLMCLGVVYSIFTSINIYRASYICLSICFINFGIFSYYSFIYFWPLSISLFFLGLQLHTRALIWPHKCVILFLSFPLPLLFICFILNTFVFICLRVHWFFFFTVSSLLFSPSIKLFYQILYSSVLEFLFDSLFLW